MLKRLGATLAILVVMAIQTGEAAMSDDEKQVRAAVDQWFMVLNAMLNGDPEPFADLYSHGDDVSYLGAEGNIRVGWDAAYADWRHQAEKAKGGEVKGTDLHVMIDGNIALAQHYTEGEVVGPDGARKPTKVRETSVFRKQGGQWKMISHHADDFRLWEQVVDQR